MLKEWDVYDDGVFVGRVMARNEEYAKSEARSRHTIEGKLEVAEHGEPAPKPRLPDNEETWV